ncbi:shikimate dehydrogenase [Methanomethylovorans sp.]|uniref:shikimate dehydrogenase n=1 Tax=Methanomethylovorans sp. TaxID=2758717 RepID=UPI000AF9F7B8|nr:shikimate dehydrogenase [Methanomethylovorans sp.]
MKKVFAVFGDPIEHSLSPVMHNAAFKALGMDCTYHAFRVSRENLKDAIKGAHAMGFGGLNLTVPLKEEALKIVQPDPLAATMGAINTVDFKCTVRGYNTDGIGAKRALVDAGVKIEGAKVLIVGAGGAARGISFKLAGDGADITIANRTPEKSIQLAEDVALVGNARGCGLDKLDELIADANVLINCTSLGMHPQVEATIAIAEQMHSGLVVFDIVYNPLKTKLLKEAEKAGAKTVSGVMMLVYQGAEAFRIWTDVEPPVEVMKEAVMGALRT